MAPALPVGMRTLSTIRPHAIATLVALGIGCIDDTARDDEPAVSPRRQALVEENGLTTNALISNALISNGQVRQALVSNALISNALISNGQVRQALVSNALVSNALISNGMTEGELARMALKYIYSCAMPEGHDMDLIIDGVGYGTLKGKLGVAPEWAEGACDENCQRWVSACVLARTNYWGVPVKLSLRAPGGGPTGTLVADDTTPFTSAEDPDCAGKTEAQCYTEREGTFYGNIFATRVEDYRVIREMYSCSGPASDEPSLTARYCSSVGAGPGCAMTVVGECDVPVCTDSDLSPWNLRACEVDAAGLPSRCYDESFDCREPAPFWTKDYTQLITVYLKKPLAVCGNSICEGDETEASCPEDCVPGWAMQVVASNAIAAPTGGVTAGAGGQLTVAGVFTGTVSFGGADLTAPDHYPLAPFQASYAADGAHVWSRAYAGDDLPLASVRDAAGGLVVAGANDSRLVVRRYDAAGEPGWAVEISLSVTNYPVRLAATPGGGVVVAAHFAGSATVDGVTHVSAGGSDILLARLDASGAVVWSRRLGAGNEELAEGLVVDAAGYVTLAGRFTGTTELGGSPLVAETCDTCVPDATDAFLARYDAAGAHLWSKRFGTGGEDSFHALGVTAAGDLIALGFFRYSVDLGAGLLELPPGRGWAVLARYTPAGNLVWARPAGPHLLYDWSAYLVVDAAGSIAIVSPMSVGMTSTSFSWFSRPWFLGKYSTTGEYLWHREIAAPAGAAVGGLAVDADGALITTGLFRKSAVFAGRILRADGLWDMFVAKVSDEAGAGVEPACSCASTCNPYADCGCWCDPACAARGDCCDDADAVVPPGSSCTAGVGICARTGYVVCAPGGARVCDAAPPGEPEPERCNGLDDDCDGATDEDGVCGFSETFDGAVSGWTLGGGWSVAAWCAHGGSAAGLCYGNGGASYPASSTPSTAAKTFAVPAAGGTLTFKYRYQPDVHEYGSYDAFRVLFGGSVLVGLTAGARGDGAWTTITWPIPPHLWGTTQTFEASFHTMDGAYNSGWGAGLDDVTVIPNATTFYRDADGDGFGDPARSVVAAHSIPGWVAQGGDCDDTDATVHPDAAEVCNGRDDDCDGGVDEGLIILFYRDADGDGFGDPWYVVGECAPRDGYVTNDQDCDDTRATVHPAAAEVCNARDDDCDAAIDEGGVCFSESFDGTVSGWTFGAGWGVATWCAFSGKGLCHGDGTSYPTSTTETIASRSISIPATGGTLTFRYRYSPDPKESGTYDRFAVKFGGHEIVALTAGTKGDGAWKQITWTIPSSLWGTTKTFQASFHTRDSLYNAGWGAAIDQIAIVPNP